MSYTVRWTKAARDQLAAVWLTHPNRKGVTAAAHRLDLLLGRDPEGQGESRADNRRIVFESPLVAVYRIDSTARVVIVSHVRRY
ncbi:MAG: hypothetical protein U0871_21090 [Gemmataceae bacterium]